MPRYVRPNAGGDLEAVIEVLGNRVRVAILGYLRRCGPSTRKEIVDGLEVSTPTITDHLRVLVDHDAIVTDPPLEMRRRGQAVTYDINPPVVDRFYAELGRAIGAADRRS
jgi:DNA-binding transcriptional ArsR family regulator